LERISLKPVEMTPGLMQALEDQGLIIRLCPDHHALPARAGEALAESIYESDPAYGPHKLITVTVDRTALAAFGTHADNEEFLLIGDPETKPLYLVLALHRKQELQRRIAEGRLAADAPGRPASFYVTEPRDMETELTEFGEYQIGLTE
jgi:hypothetical protein